MPCLAAHSAVARDPAPHQIRSRRPGECGSGRSSPGGFGNIGEGLGLCKPDPGQCLEEDFGVLPGHIGVGLAVGRRVAEVSEAVDDLLGRSAADPELQTAAGDEVGGTGVFDHVERVLVAHVDDGRADLDPLGASADRRQQREWRRQLLGEVVDSEVGTVGPQVLDRLGELDGLDERVRGRPDLRVGRRRPVPEREETDLLHGPILSTHQPVGRSGGGHSGLDRRRRAPTTFGTPQSISIWRALSRNSSRTSRVGGRLRLDGRPTSSMQSLSR